MKRAYAIILIISTLFSFIGIDPALTQSEIIIAKNQITSNFPGNLIFELSASSSTNIEDIRLVYWTSGETCQSAKAHQDIDFDTASQVDVEWELDFTLSGILPPGTEIYWQWEITDAAGNTQITDEQTYLVNDLRFAWKKRTSGQVILQWYEGDANFGRFLMDVALRSLERLANDAGVRPTGQIWITVYPTTKQIQEVDTHTTEWAGGLAYPAFNSTIMAIFPGDITYGTSVIPHELAHLVTESVVFNCRGLWLPTWLSEGLATYAEGDESVQMYTEVIKKELEKNNLPPLRTLERGFSSDSYEAQLSYGHSAMMVSFIIEQYGAEKMAELLATIKSGQLINKALTSVYGKDTDSLEAEWRVSLGFAPQPTRAATVARTSVPTLALWTAVNRRTDTPTPTPIPSYTSIPIAPTATPEVIVTLISPSTIQNVISTPIDPPESSTSSSPILPFIILSIVFLLLISIVIFFIMKRRVLP